MIADIVVFDTINKDTNDIPSFITDQFNPKTTHIVKFNDLFEMGKYLFTAPGHILKPSKDGILLRLPNVKEEEINYPTGLIINDESDCLSNHHDLKLPKGVELTVDLSVPFIIERFHHLNLIVQRLKFSDLTNKKPQLNHNQNHSQNHRITRSQTKNTQTTTSATNPLAQLSDNLDNVYKMIESRLHRVKTWVGLNEEEFTLDQQAQLHINSMINSLNCHNSVERVDSQLLSKTETFELLGLANDVLDYKSLLTIPHEDNYYQERINRWGFPAYELTSDELLYSAFLMFKAVVLQTNVDSITH
ncbi:unnamed protein product [Ambrosiozyma monospora]|uniref:Unnamed protein product n=1 Tax=Ambrosiozyma monospora TaxID=43982 RepID=A0ACB5U0Z5_AMBMO|nr:unnamed protein product [Ambrosiozyma monospora]